MPSKSRLAILEEQFAEHKYKEEAWQSGVDNSLKVIVGNQMAQAETLADMNHIELNGNGKIYTVREAFNEFYSVWHRSLMWRRIWIRFTKTGRLTKVVLIVGVLYFGWSVLNDFGVVQTQPLTAIKNIIPVLLRTL